jgi:hypothetical protein
MLRRLALLLFGLVPASLVGQQAGTFAGDFVGSSIIKMITCSAGDTDLSCSNGGAAFLGATIKMPGASNRKLMITGSLETALLTQTGITGGGGKQTASATGSIVVRPEVTGPFGQRVQVWPPVVTYDERTQALTANLSGCITNPDSLGVAVAVCTDSESVNLLLSTLSAHSFTFLAQSVGQGTYTVKLHIGATATATSTSITAKSLVGVGVGAGSLAISMVQVPPFNSLCFDLINGTSC